MQKSQLTDFGSTYLENIAMMDNSLSLALRITCSLWICTVYVAITITITYYSLVSLLCCFYYYVAYFLLLLLATSTNTNTVL